MKTLGYYNGKIGEIEEIQVPMNDRACFFGDGVYDATITANHIIFALDDHINRFFSSASLVDIPLPFTKPELGDLLKTLVKKVETPDLFVYWQATRGTASRAHAFPEDAKTNIWAMIRPIVMPDLEKKLQFITTEDTRYFHCNIKTINLLPNVLASEKAKKAGCYEAIFHRGDRVTECTRSNIHILKDGTLHTAPADNLILPGIARSHLIQHCKLLNIPVIEKAFTLDQMMNADEVIMTSSSTFCASADKIDEKPVGGKAEEILKKLRTSLLNEFKEATKI